MKKVSDSDMELISRYFNTYQGRNGSLKIDRGIDVVLEGLITIEITACKLCAALIEVERVLDHANWHLNTNRQL